MVHAPHTHRWVDAALLLGSLLPYLEWGGGNAAFLGQMEYQVLFGSTSWTAFLHPLVILPLAGQLLLVIGLVRRTPHRWLTTVGVVPIGVLVVLIAVGGMLTRNGWSVVSVLPFAAAVAWHVRGTARGASRH